mmetsp:Transcript_29562/g.69479  ORF Transcript_29562/g.69479 Transcript_29562/m.69479 type:complete len:152 (+) Transcript_29562:14-469(+)
MVCSPNWFVYGWLIRFLVDRAISGGKPPTDLVQALRTAEFGDTMRVTEGRLPHAEWDDVGRVRLYDLATDPFERHNLAANHTDVVEEMVRRMRGEVRGLAVQGHHLSVQLQFSLFLRGVVGAVLAVVFVLLVTCCCCCAWPRSRSKKTKQQ